MGAIEYYIASQDKSYNPVIVSDLFKYKVYELADVNNLDLNIFSLEGELLLSSNQSLFEKDILDEQIEPELLQRILKKERVFIDEENLDSISLFNSFQLILDISDYPIAIANVPYFDVNKQMSIESKTFLKTLTETYLFFFILALGIAFYLAKYITRSLKAISDNIKSTRMNKRNKRLVWNSKDEIGVVVEEYNRMLEELEQSAEILARTERESAWREMAKQVAHEIKNPLTPMKLSVQQMERKLNKNDPDFEESMKRFLASMTDQIETLSSIASSFSRFATLPVVEMTILDLGDLLRGTTSLYVDKNLSIELPKEAVLVKADREQLIRVVHNLVQNAFQAIPEDREAEVELKLKTEEDHALISIKDNGTGIAEDQKERIFQPSFTTKTSGMGLGLSIVKKIVENHGGEIYFDSSENKGTCFYFKLPLATE